MPDEPAHPGDAAETFEPEEKPTNPSAPAPEELAMHSFLASATRGIGPLRTDTSRFRAVAVVALEGGAARLSHVDLLEATAREAAAQAPIEAASTGEGEPAAAPAPSHASPPEAPVEVAPMPPVAPARLPPGPRGTVRIAPPRWDRGPTGTVKMPARPERRAAAEDAEERRAARGRFMVVAAVVLLCAIEVVWLAAHAVSTPTEGPMVPPAAHPSALQSSPPSPPAAAASSPATPDEATPPAPTEQRPSAPPARSGPSKRRHGSTPSSVF